MKSNITWPNGAKFAFTVFDDTDNSTIENCKPVYDYLIQRGILTTKSVWVYPSRGRYLGESLADRRYLDWIRELDSSGVEVGLHGVGDGAFSRNEIVEGLEEFKNKLGHYPKIHCNHAANPDNLYWGTRRFVFPISLVYKVMYFLKGRRKLLDGGDKKGSVHFWGDVVSNKIKYVRNLTYTGVNTLTFDSKMPWHDPTKPFVNYWFSSSDGADVKAFNDLISPENLDKLEEEGGACIIYTHFASGFVDGQGNLDETFKVRINDLAARQGWFVPSSQLLDFLLDQRSSSAVTYMYRLSRNIVWVFERLKKYVKHRV